MKYEYSCPRCSTVTIGNRKPGIYFDKKMDKSNKVTEKLMEGKMPDTIHMLLASLHSPTYTICPVCKKRNSV